MILYFVLHTFQSVTLALLFGHGSKYEPFPPLLDHTQVKKLLKFK